MRGVGVSSVAVAASAVAAAALFTLSLGISTFYSGNRNISLLT